MALTEHKSCPTGTRTGSCCLPWGRGGGAAKLGKSDLSSAANLGDSVSRSSASCRVTFTNGFPGSGPGSCEPESNKFFPSFATGSHRYAGLSSITQSARQHGPKHENMGRRLCRPCAEAKHGHAHQRLSDNASHGQHCWSPIGGARCARRLRRALRTPRDMRRAKACFMASTKRWAPSVPAAGIRRWYPAHIVNILIS